MFDRYNIISLGLGEKLQLTIRFYRETLWGRRRLGKGRYALDIGHISFLWEYYGG